MRFFKNSNNCSGYEALILQYRELLEKLRNNNNTLRKNLLDAEHRLDSILKIFFPKIYYDNRPDSLKEMLNILIDCLEKYQKRKIY